MFGQTRQQKNRSFKARRLIAALRSWLVKDLRCLCSYGRRAAEPMPATHPRRRASNCRGGLSSCARRCRASAWGPPIHFMVNMDAFRSISFWVDIKNHVLCIKQLYRLPANVSQPRLLDGLMYVNPSFCLCNACHRRISTIDCVLRVWREV